MKEQSDDEESIGNIEKTVQLVEANQKLKILEGRLKKKDVEWKIQIKDLEKAL